MAFWKKLFGGGTAGAEVAAAKADYKGFVIEARPRKESGQYQLAGTISRGEGAQRQEHHFVRADRFSALEDATSLALVKGRQIIDERGEGLFDS